MQAGLTIAELASRVKANQTLKHDLIADTRAVTMRIDDDKAPSLQIETDRFGVMPIAHDQIASRLNIPARYYARMQADAPDLLADNVNHWFRNSPEKRMIRTLGGDVRAFLSNRYQRIENEEIANVTLPILADVPDLRFISTQVTDARMYIHAVAPRITGEVNVGDVVQAGIIISNSEVGLGSVSIKPLIYRLVCKNGMIMPDGKFTARHVGAKIDNSQDLWSDEAKRADDRAILLKVRDVVRAILSEKVFTENLDKMRALTERRLTGNPVKAVEVLAQKVGASEAEHGDILRSLIEGGDLSAWGLLNAVTHQAHTAKSYDRAVELEQAGGALVDLAPKDWREILEAA